MTLSQNRVMSLPNLAQHVRELQQRGKVVAHCHGCFDILHFGHVRHFEAARELADALVVTVTPDRYVNKGPGRPVFPEDQRAEVVAGLRAVDAVSVNLWASAVDTIKLVRADLFVKGQEYQSSEQQVNPNFAAEAKTVASIGARVAFTQEATSSSTAAVKRINIALGTK